LKQLEGNNQQGTPTNQPTKRRKTKLGNQNQNQKQKQNKAIPKEKSKAKAKATKSNQKQPTNQRGECSRSSRNDGIF
jgi:hypothetical protein